MTVAYGTCVGSWLKAAQYVLPWTGASQVRPLMAVSGAQSIAKAYNQILDAYQGQGFDAVILLHDDLQILDPDAEEKFLAAIEPDVALVGVIGGKGIDSLHWWNSEKVGHQLTDSGLLDFPPRTGDVGFIDGDIMCFTPWAVENLRFDERWTDFRSGYDDICVTARTLGLRNVVVDVDTHHHTKLGWRSAEVEARFAESERIFREKWAIS